MFISNDDNNDSNSNINNGYDNCCGSQPLGQGKRKRSHIH